VSKQVLEDCRCFTIAPQADGFTIAKYPEVAKESNLQRRLNNGGMFSPDDLLDNPPHGFGGDTTGRKRAHYGPVAFA
jgi:hypothetical protein